MKKTKYMCGRTLDIGLSKYVKTKVLPPLSFPGKTGLVFSLFECFWVENGAVLQVKGLELKSNI